MAISRVVNAEFVSKHCVDRVDKQHDLSKSMNQRNRKEKVSVSRSYMDPNVVEGNSKCTCKRVYLCDKIRIAID
jgi:hypothetical protein